MALANRTSAAETLLSDLPRGRSPEDIGRPPSACFEPTKNILATPSVRLDPRGNAAAKTFLGVVGGDIQTGRPLRDGRINRWVAGGLPIGIGDDRHHLLLSQSRGGKGRSSLIPNLWMLPYETSVLVIDPKGDLARITAPYRLGVLGQSGGILDPFDCCGPGTHQYNVAFNAIELLVRSSPQLLVANARLIADALIVVGHEKDPHWNETAKQIAAGLCTHVATHVNYEGRRDLTTVARLASELLAVDPHDPSKYWLKEEMLASDAASGMVRAAAREFYDRSGDEFSSVLSNLRKHLDWITYDCMRDVLTGNSIDLRDLKRSNVAFYVTLPAMRMDTLRGWLRLIVQLALAACEEETTLVGNPCVLMLDEFHALGRMNALETAVSEIAGLGARLYLALPNLSQLQCYEKNYETFIANAGVVQVMGCADETTLEYISKRMGQAVGLTRSSHAPTFEQATQQGLTGESWSLAQYPLMTPEEIGRYFSRDDRLLRQLILRPGFRPMVLQRAFYDKHELFAARRGDGE